MFEFTATIRIDTSIKDLWDFLIDIKQWWLASNSDHIALDILSESHIVKKGTCIRIQEKIAGIPGQAEGEVTELVDHKRIRWQSEQAQYHFLGIPLTVKEGVTWELETVQDDVQLSAHVWALFPDSLFGKSSEWIFKNLLNGVAKDYEHAMTELRYIKVQMES